MLRFFRSFRELEARALKAEALVDLLQDQLARSQDAFIAERNESRRLANESVQAAQRTADYIAETKFGHPIFDRVSDLPVDPTKLEPVRSTRPQARELVAEKYAEFEKSFFTAAVGGIVGSPGTATNGAPK